MMIDPASEDPMRFLQFRKRVDDGKWVPFARRSGDEGARARKTIKCLRLATHPDLIEIYQRHVTDYVEPEIEEINDVVEQGVESDVQTRWGRVTAKLLRVASRMWQGWSMNCMGNSVVRRKSDQLPCRVT